MTTLRISSLTGLRALLAAALVAIGAAAAIPAGAAPPAPGLSPSLGAWRSIPVLEDGRIMPLDTFARRHVETICHVQEPKLAVVTGEPLTKWHADELLLDWLVRPAAWEDVPFLTAEHEELRKLLGLELFADTPKGRVRLKYAAPSDVADSEPLRQRLIDLDGRRTEAMKEGRQFQAEGVDAKVEQLWQAYVTWRQLVFRAADDAVGRTRFLRTFEQLVTTWKPLREKLPQAEATSVDGALQGLAEVMGNSTRFPTEEVLPRLTTLRQAIDALAVSGDAPADIRRGVRRLGDRFSALGEALYDNGGSLHVVPALHADALEAERSTEDDMPAWLAWPTLLDAEPDLLPGYPADRVRGVRAAFETVAAAVKAPATDLARPADVAAATENLASRLRSLGEAVEPLRAGLPIERPDADLLSHTAYPPFGSTKREVTYNVGDPFRMSWVAALLALAAYAVSIGRARVPLFWLATFLLLFQLAWTAQAFASRVAITGWAPVTNMYETVIYVPFFLTFLGLCFLLGPIMATGMGDAWRMTAVPPPVGSMIPGEATPLDATRARLHGGARGWGAINWLLLLPRIALSALVLWILAMAPYAAGGRTIINLFPQTDVDRSIPNLNNLVVWLVGWSMLAPAVWYLPRVILTTVVSLFSVPSSWRRGTFAAEVPEVYRRKSFGLVVAAVAFAGTFIAWFFPIPGKQFSPLQPVLRDNFWLTIHVLTIVSSYAAGALAWGLGILSLGHYLLGSYPRGSGGRSRPPEACVELAGYIYKSMQVAVILLAAGTILGGLWADVSWGRFWGWDPKEVWALVSLLAYMMILHGRYAGWIGSFGLAAGAVLGAAVIGMSWYGVNFLLGAGLHSYGFGQGGQTEFFTFLVANFVLLAAAGWRMKNETRQPAAETVKAA